MSKIIAAVALCSVASVCVIGTGLAASGGEAVPPEVIIPALALMIPGVAAIAYVVMREMAADRKYRRMQEEGRRYCEKSDAEFRARKQDQSAIDALEKALAA